MGLNYRPVRRVVTLRLDLEDIDTVHPDLPQCTVDITAADEFFNEREMRWIQNAYENGLYTASADAERDARMSDVENRLPVQDTPHVFESWEAALPVFCVAAVGLKAADALQALLLGHEALVPEFGSAAKGWKTLAATLPSSTTMPVMLHSGQSIWLCFLVTGGMAAGTAAMTFGNAVFVRVGLPVLDAFGEEAKAVAGPAARAFLRRVLRVPKEESD